MPSPQWSVDSLAGLARVALARGDLAGALEHVEKVMTFLQVHPNVECTAEPLRIYLTCYNVLHAVDDPRAEEVLDAAHQLLRERAARIEDQVLRRSYLENVSYHRQIVGAWEKKEPSV
jgi:hypothetical protein